MARKPKSSYVKRRSPSEQAIIENQATLFDYMLRFQKIATSMFEWVNLPDTCDERWLERSLFYDGIAALLWSDKLSGFINTQAAAGGRVNIYGLPTDIKCYSFEYEEMRDLYQIPGIPGHTKDQDCILVMNTRDRIPTISSVYYFAKRMTDCQRTIDVNVNAQRTPVTILTDENQRLSMLNAYKQYEENAPVIVGDSRSLDFERVKVLNTQAPYVTDKLMKYKQEIWNEFLTFLGVNNLRDKRERLVEDEAEQNNEVINYNLQSFLLPRQQAAREFNDKYGLVGEDRELKVRVRSDLHNIIKQYESIVNDYDLKLEEENV